MVKVKTVTQSPEVLFNGLGKKYEEFPSGEFKLNGQLLQDENGENMNSEAVISQIEQDTAHFVGRQFAQIVLLAGAGSSISGKTGAKRVGRSMKDLTLEIENVLNKEKLLNLKALASLSKYPFLDYTSKDFNLEDLMSRIERAQEYVADEDKANFEVAYTRIHKVIQEATAYDYDSTLLHHDRIIKMLSDRVVAPNKLTVATTNYDTLIEQASIAQGYSIIDGFSYDSDPRFDADNFEWNLVRDIPNLATSELEYKKQVINLIKLHGSLTWERSGDGTVHRLTKSAVDKPLMIFPSSDKYMQSYTEPYFDLFSKFQELLSRPKTLLISNGFSFGDNHISQMVHHAIMHNGGLSVMITDNNITSQSNPGWESLEKLMSARYPVIFVKATMNTLSDFLGVDYSEY
ncbi:Hypothetical protein LCAKO_2129 [Lacticaseibacillus paracasei subsp. paracasei]|uniref:SIR2-like domain-containing protein n=1 Tax=Lacticaseibacillus paracasei subsp. paracasei TaxID=47714 RepID=A0AAP9HI83_LACPA|nr:Hypothetical protein LCAKO_2129 [Lacticaseibacillus paracasei subsp. paracasei]